MRLFVFMFGLAASISLAYVGFTTIVPNQGVFGAVWTAASLFVALVHMYGLSRHLARRARR